MRASVTVTVPLESTSQVHGSHGRRPSAPCSTNTALTTQRVSRNGWPQVRHASSSSLQVSPQALVGGQVGSPMQLLSSQRSPVVQNSPSSHAPVLGSCAHVPSPSQASSVQTLPSDEHGVPAATRQVSAASLQTLLHSGFDVHGLPLPLQTPPWQTSVAVQNAPSLHGVVFGFATLPQTPVCGLQTPSLQVSATLEQSTAAPAAQTPAAHSSAVVQGFPSLHGVPLVRATASHWPLSALQVPTAHAVSSCEHTTGVPAQTPAVQTSPVVHAFPSLHTPFSLPAAVTHWPVSGLQVFVWQTLPGGLQTTGEPEQMPLLH
jgi:hypothetical protein